MNRIYNKEITNHCPLVNDRASFQTCLKCCFKGKTNIGQFIDYKIVIGEMPTEVYDSISVDCMFKLSLED